MRTPNEVKDALPPEVLRAANSDELMRWPLERIRRALIAEITGPNRPLHVRRLHQRWYTKRRDEERRELARCVKNREIPGFLKQGVTQQ